MTRDSISWPSDPPEERLDPDQEELEEMENAARDTESLMSTSPDAPGDDERAEGEFMCSAKSFCRNARLEALVELRSLAESEIVRVTQSAAETAKRGERYIASLGIGRTRKVRSDKGEKRKP